MHNLIRFILKHHFILLFVIIQTFSLTLMFQHNNFHKSVAVNAVRSVKGAVNKRIFNFKEYMKLREINEKLIYENSKLRNQLMNSFFQVKADTVIEFDSVYKKQYRYISAKIADNSTNKQHNYITIDKGKIHGVETEMGVVSTDGIVGIVTGVSDHFSTVMPILNINLRISAKIEESGFFGSLFWNGRDPGKASLIDIPHHAELNEGDNIVTSGYSAIFPEGIRIGTITGYEIEGGNFYNATVELSTDFQNLSHVYVIVNYLREEQSELENINLND